MNVESKGQQVQLQTAGYEVTPANRKQIEAGLGKIEKILGGKFPSKVILAVEKHRHKAEITIYSYSDRHRPGVGSLVGTAEAHNMVQAIGEALEHLEKQVKSKTSRTSVLLDKTQPLQARINAAEALAKGGRDDAAWGALWWVIDAEDEEVALRCAAIRFLPDGTRFAIEYLTRPYLNREVRNTAIETLENMGPVKGEDEVMLLAQLAALRGTASDEYVAAALNSVTGDLKELLSSQMRIHAG